MNSPRSFRRAVSVGSAAQQQDETHEAVVHGEDPSGGSEILFAFQFADDCVGHVHAVGIEGEVVAEAVVVGKFRGDSEQCMVAGIVAQVVHFELEPFREIENIDYFETVHLAVAMRTAWPNQENVAVNNRILPFFGHVQSGAGTDEYQLKEIMLVEHLILTEIFSGPHPDAWPIWRKMH